MGYHHLPHTRLRAVVEEQKTGAQKEANDLRAGLRDAERARLDAHREAQELLRQVKHLEGERSRLEQEVSELQQRLTRSEEREEELRRELFASKQKVCFARLSSSVFCHAAGHS